MRTSTNSYCIFGRRVSKVALLLLLSVAISRPAWALDVIGNINVDTTWKKSDSPVRLTGDVTVQSHVLLTIEPGTIVEAATTDALGAGADPQKVELIVKGRILATGTSASPIDIHGATNGANNWYGLTFDPLASESALIFVRIRDAVIGIDSHTQKPLTLSDVSVSASGIGIKWQATPGPTLTRVQVNASTTIGVQVDDDGTAGAQAVLNAVSIQNCGGAGLKLGPRIFATINGSWFLSNQTGIDAGAGSALQLTSSLIVGNRQVGLLLNQTATNIFSIINNTLDRNNSNIEQVTSPGVGLRVAAVSDPSKFIVRNNNITNHGTVGVDVIGGTSPSLDHNNVWNNVANYSTGISGGTGSLNTNPLYRAALVTSPTPGGSFSHLGYPDNDRYTFECSDPAAFAMRVSFTAFATESGYDIVQIRDSYGNVVQTYSGTMNPFTTPLIPGNKLTISFTSDGGGRLPGFAGACQTTQLIYRLQATSPVLDMGNALLAPATDFDGIARPVDGDFDGTAAVDIGAFEFHVNKPPVAKAGSDLTVLVNKPVVFDGRASFDPDGAIASYSWNFGDSSPAATEVQPTHSFATQGNFTVTLTVTDDEGQTSTSSLTVTVTDNLPPVASAGQDQRVAPGTSVAFDGSASIDTDGTITDYSWNFGDGTPAAHGTMVNHSFANPGVYGVVLTVTDNKGIQGTDTVVITVGMPANADMMTDPVGNGQDAGSKGRDAGTGGPGSGEMTGPGKGDTVGCGCFIASGEQNTQVAAMALLAGLALVLWRRRMQRHGRPAQ